MSETRLRKLEEALRKRQLAYEEAAGSVAGGWRCILGLILEKGAEAAGDKVSGTLVSRLAADGAEDRCVAEVRNLGEAVYQRWLAGLLVPQGIMSALTKLFLGLQHQEAPTADAPLLDWAAWYWPHFSRRWGIHGRLTGMLLLPEKVSPEDWVEAAGNGSWPFTKG